MSPESRRLVRSYRRAQQVLSDRTETALRQLWEMLTAGRLSATADPWAASATAAVAAGFARSRTLGELFYRRFRQAETGITPREIVRPRFDAGRARGVLLATGPGLIRSNLAKGLTFRDAVSKAEYWATGAGVREALTGARETVRGSSTADALGWARAAEGDACAFCAMLASRGYVFGAEETAEFEAHVGCNCYPVPAYDRNQALPDNSERFRQQWNESDGTLQGFRRHLTEVRGDQA